MIKKILLFVCSFLFALNIHAQVNSINPDTGLKSQSLITTITMAGGLMTNATAPWQSNDIYLQQGATVIYCTTINWPSTFDWILMRNVYADSGEVTFNIPSNVPSGWYDVNVNIYPFAWPVTQTLTNGFFVGAPAGTISGNLFFDMNQNGIKDIGELPVGNQRIQISPTNEIAFTNPGGDFTYYADTGIYTVSYLPAPTFSQTSIPLTYTDTIPPSKNGRNFGTYSSVHMYDNDAYVVRTRYRCNESSRLLVEVKNSGFLPVRHVVTVSTNNFPYVSSTIPPDFVNGNARTWIIPSLGGGASELVGGIMYYNAPNAWNWVDVFIVDTVYDMSGNLIDILTDSYTDVVRCSYDPNDKHSSPEGVMFQNYTPITSPLTYHINFQNTGNDTAYNVTILDTLDVDLDLSTFEVLGSSHTVTPQMTASGAMRFNFFNIMLPDSNTDEPGSHGWITYRISPKSGLPDPTLVTNTSYIVFDLNPPVVTNTTLNTLTALQYPESDFSATDQAICETDCILYNNLSTSGTTYQWIFQGGSPATSTSASPGAVCYSTSGAYDVTLITTNALGSDTLSQIAYVNVAPSPGVFTVNQTGDSLIAPQGFDTYQWYYNNVLIPGATDYFYVATLDGDYGIVVGNANGCHSGVNIPNVIIGVNELSDSNGFIIYPNPSDGQFKISYNSMTNEIAVISIIDKIGQVVKSAECKFISGSNKIEMNTKELASGIYNIKIQIGSNVITKRLILNK